MTGTAASVEMPDTSRLHRLLGVPLAVALVTLIVVVDLAAGAGTVLAGLLVVGPAVAAASAGPRGVVGVGLYALVGIAVVTPLDDLWGTAELPSFVLAVVAVTALSGYAASWRDRVLGDVSALAEIVRSSRDAIIGKDLDGTITSWNEAAHETYGWSAEEAVGRHISLIVPEERRAELEEALARVTAGDRVPFFLTQRMTKDGRLLDVTVSISPVRAADGRVVGLAAMGRDVTAQIREQEAVRASEARKAAILAGALDPVVTIDHRGLVIEVNPAMEATFGWTAEEMVGAELAAFIVPPESREAHRSGLLAYLRTGESPLIGTRLTLTALHRDGRRLPVEVTITRVDVPGDPVFTGYLRDLSARNAAEEEAERLRDRLRQTDRLDALGQLAGGIAHDFNNLLAVILTYSDLAHHALPPGGPRDDVDEITAAAKRASHLTRQLLTFSRGDQGKNAVSDVNAVAQQVCDVLRRTLPATITLETRLAADVWPARCDTTRLDQILVNLAVNARDAMPAGGTLTVETRNIHLDELASGSRVLLAPGRYVVLAVTDSGTGMTKEVQQRAFDPFFTTKAQGEGTGLGLATVYGIARQMDGEVSIYSEPGQGTTVRLHLPAADALEARSPEPAVQQAVQRGHRVLLVEDEEMLRRPLVRSLTEVGFVVRAAGSAEEALRLCEEDASAPDLLVTDVTLPGMTGHDLANRLRERWPGLPVVVMTGYAASRLPEQLSARVVMLSKPFDFAELMTAAGELLNLRQERTQP